MLISNSYKILILILIVAGCTKSNSQKVFENDAKSSIQGYTETDIHGKINPNHVDQDDWRIGPMFHGYVQVNIPPYPNPTNNQQIKMELNITGLSEVTGLYVYDRTPSNKYVQVLPPNDAVLDPGILPLTFEPIQMSNTGNVADIRGLNRILIYDGQQNLITYGDILVE